jgi:hypothetical protein
VLDDLARHEILEQRAEERRAVEHRFGFDPEEVARQARVGQVHPGRLDEPLAEALEERRDQQELRGHLENREPLRDGGHGHAEQRGEIGAVERL